MLLHSALAGKLTRHSKFQLQQPGFEFRKAEFVEGWAALHLEPQLLIPSRQKEQVLQLAVKVSGGTDKQQ
jgi:hypothetical protein